MIRRLRIEILAEVLIKDDRLHGEPVKIRRLDPLVAVTAEVTEMEAVESDDESMHGRGRSRQ
jgi:hypothetical protein